MIKGKEVVAKLRKGKSGGIPWMVILDKNGKELITSDGPDGNVGCPVKPKERKWFTHMIKLPQKISPCLNSHSTRLLRSWDVEWDSFWKIHRSLQNR